MSPFRLILTRLGHYPKQLFAACLALIITAGITLSLGQGIRWVIDRGLAADDIQNLKLGLAFLMGISIVMAIGTYIRFYMMSWLGERISADLRFMAFNRLLEQHPDYFDNTQSGEIMTRITTDASILQSLVGSSISMALRNVLMSIGGLIMMLTTSPALTALILVTVPVVLVPILVLGRRVRALSRASQDRLADVGQNAGEALGEIRAVRAFGQIQATQNRFIESVEAAFQVARRRIAQRSALIAAVIVLVFCALSVMLWVGGQAVINQTLTPGELSAFVFYALLVAMGAATLAEVISEVQRASGATERLAEFINLPTPRAHGTDPFPTNQPIEFSDVHFCYPSRPDHPILQGLNCEFLPGQTTAVVGSSGAGKSTLFELILRFRPVDSGLIKVGSAELSELSERALREAISTVPQQPTLFSASIAENIAFGRPDASIQDIQRAATLAGAHDFISATSVGYQ
ncbi:MAG: ABC transporter transmembrane domain-containing protein, partial [Pseudomonadales bacterium]